MCLGIPGRLVARNSVEDLPMGVVDFGGVTRDVCLAYVADEVSVGDYVIVHVGFAISVVDEQQAQRALKLLREMGRADELLLIRDTGDLVDGYQSGEAR
ncbi:MAG: HypC/HybG/HupF family hydrogenase formation chaperone [Gemmatimonadota bacterium]|nr:MAG: HypC/HybG/HupF family hydrogenase formation chaperone [Gemmatimonadota bacterium]